MLAAAGLLVALTCLAIVALAFALAVTSWRPGAIPSLAATAGFSVGAAAFLITAAHWLAHQLT